MATEWTIAGARSNFTRLIEGANSDGQQVITRRGKEVAVVVSWAEFQRPTSRLESLAKLLRASQLAGIDLDLRRT